MKTFNKICRFWTIGIFGIAIVFASLFLFSACSCSSPGPKENEITINVESKAYDGEAIVVTATTLSGTAPTIHYRLEKAGGTEDLDVAPNGVGVYFIDASVAAEEGYLASSKTVSFSITQKELAVNWTQPESLVYSGEAKVLTAQLDETGILEGEECTMQFALTTGKDNVNAGKFTYTASLSGADAHNYCLPNNGVSNEYEITPKEVELQWTAPASLVYDGQPKVPTVALSGLVGTDECEVQKVVTEEGSNIGVGAFTFTATSLTNQNYKLPQNVVSSEYAITPKELVFDWTAPANLVFDGQPKIPTIQVTGILNDDNCNVQIGLSEGHNNTKVGVFTYTASMYGVDKDNYSLPTNAVSPSYTITPFVLQNLNEEFVYDGGTKFAVDVTGMDGIIGTLSLEFTFESKNVGAEVASYAFKRPSGMMNSNYAIDNTCTAVIVQKEVNFAWDPADTEFCYEFKIAQVPRTPIEGLVAGDDCTVAKTPNGDNESAGSTFTFTATGLTGADAGNYSLSGSAVMNSPSYYIEYGSLVEIDEVFEPWTEIVTSSQTGYFDDYFRVNLVADKQYYLDYVVASGNSYSYEIFKKNNLDEWESIETGALTDSGSTTTPFVAPVSGEYLIKIIQQTYLPIDDSEQIIVKEQTI